MRLLFVILSLLSLTSQPQTVKDYCKRNAVTWGCMIVAGGCDGLAESVKFHWESTDRKLKLNDAQWNPSTSWMNKYKNGDPAQGEAYWQSTRLLVWTTDGYHRTRMMRNMAICTGIAFHLGHKQKWFLYGLDILSYSLAYSIGFNLTYEALK